MKFVYTTRYENVRAFTTARKAVESCIGGDWEAYMGAKTDAEGHIVESVMLPVTAENVAKLITRLNKQGFLSLKSGREQMQLDRTPVE